MKEGLRDGEREGKNKYKNTVIVMETEGNGNTKISFKIS